MNEDLKRMGGIRTTGKEAFYAFFVKEDGDCRLVGLVVLHMDDFNTVGTEEFRKNITDQLQRIYMCLEKWRTGSIYSQEWILRHQC